MVQKYKIIINAIALFLLISFAASSWSAEDKIANLQEQISDLEEQKAQLEAEKSELVAEGDELSFKIDGLKIQAKGGLGIIGRYKLSRSLRKAQSLGKKIDNLEKKILKIESELKGKKSELGEEYENQISLLMKKLGTTSQNAERAKILEKLKEYQTAKKVLEEPEEEKIESLDITKIEIHEYDGPQEIREKADLINDFAAKINNRLNMLNTRTEKLAEELRTRKRLGEFAEEISFFEERISIEEVVSDAGKDAATDPVETLEKTDDASGGAIALDSTVPPTLATDSADDIRASQPVIEMTEKTEIEPSESVLAENLENQPTEEVQPVAASSKMVLERNGISASFAVVSLEQIKREMELLEKQGEALAKELAILAKKANSFYKKADDIEKAGTKKSGEKGTQR